MAWLDDLARAAESSGEDYPADVAQRLVYVLMPVRDDPRMPQLGVQPVSARLLKDGTFSAQSRPVAANSAAPGGPKYFRPSDGRIMRDLARLPSVYAMSLYRLADDAGAEVLALVLATGRARWLTLDGPALRAGPARPGTLSWAEAGEGALLPRLALGGEGTALATTPPVYVDPAAGLVGPVETGRPARVAAALFRAPPVAATATCRRRRARPAPPSRSTAEASSSRWSATPPPRPRPSGASCRTTSAPCPSCAAACRPSTPATSRPATSRSTGSPRSTTPCRSSRPRAGTSRWRRTSRTASCAPTAATTRSCGRARASTGSSSTSASRSTASAST